MKKFLVFSCALLFIFIANGKAGALTLTFDDIPGISQDSYGPIGSYGGFDFGTANVHNRMDWIDTVGSPYWDFGSVSGDFTMLNNYGGSAIITSSTGADFTFDGLWARLWPDYTYATYRLGNITGYKDGYIIFSSNIDLTNAWTHFNGGIGQL